MLGSLGTGWAALELRDRSAAVNGVRKAIRADADQTEGDEASESNYEAELAELPSGACEAREDGSVAFLSFA